MHRVDTRRTLSEKVAEAKRHAVHNRTAIERSALCGCYECVEVFPSSAIVHWDVPEAGEEATAICPRCGSAAVVPGDAGVPIERWFLEKLKQQSLGPSTGPTPLDHDAVAQRLVRSALERLTDVVDELEAELGFLSRDLDTGPMLAATQTLKAVFRAWWSNPPTFPRSEQTLRALRGCDVVASRLLVEVRERRAHRSGVNAKRTDSSTN